MNHPTTTVDVAQSTDEPTPIEIGTDVDEPTLENSLADAREADQTLVCLTGMSCSGTSTVCDLFEAMNVPSTSMGDVCRDIAAIMEFDSPWRAAEHLRNQNESEIARRTADAVRSSFQESSGQNSPHCKSSSSTAEGNPRVAADSRSESVVAVDGLRSPYEWTWYQRNINATCVLVDVFCDDTTRVQRYEDRHDVEWGVAVDELCERDERELDVGLGELLDSSQSTIYNDWDTSYTELMSQTERLVNDVRG